MQALHMTLKLLLPVISFHGEEHIVSEDLAPAVCGANASSRSI